MAHGGGSCRARCQASRLSTSSCFTGNTRSISPNIVQAGPVPFSGSSILGWHFTHVAKDALFYWQHPGPAPSGHVHSPSPQTARFRARKASAAARLARSAKDPSVQPGVTLPRASGASISFGQRGLLLGNNFVPCLDNSRQEFRVSKQAPLVQVEKMLPKRGRC